MGTKIITSFHGKRTDENRVILNFDQIKEDSLYIDFNLTRKIDDAIWEVHEGNLQHDTNDLTKGSKAELLILKSYAGSHKEPNIFNIIVKSADGNILSTVDLIMMTTPQIIEAKWVDNSETEIRRIGLNSEFTVSSKGYGIYRKQLIIKLYLLNPSSGGQDPQIDQRIVQMNDLYDLETFYLDYELLKDNFMFLAKLQTKLAVENIERLLKIQVTASGDKYKVGNVYFTITYQNEIIFNGKNNLLEVNFIIKEFLDEEKVVEVSLSPVTVTNAERYFTQRYEPCKYEKIIYKIGNNKSIELFDEKKTTAKAEDGKYLNEKLQLTLIVPPKESKNIQRLNLKLEKVSTKECSYEEENKRLTNFSSEEKEENVQPHQGKVIVLDRLKDANIKTELVKIDEEANIYPSFNYLYDKNTAWNFLTNYFLLSSMINERDAMIFNRGELMDWEIQSKGLIQLYYIPLTTCRYTKFVKLKLYADVAWATHVFYDEPNEKKFYLDREISDDNMRKGLDTYLDALINSPLLNNFSIPVGNPISNAMIQYFIIEMIKDMANKYQIGFTAYYDFDKEGKIPSQEIQYAKQFALVFDAMIAGAVTLEILIQVLLIILTEGAAAEMFLARIATKVKAGTRIAARAERAASRIASNPTYYSYMNYGRMAYSHFTLPKFSYYKGYRFQEAPNIGIEPLIEENVNFSPLLSLGIKTEKSLGDWLMSNTAPMQAIDLSKKALALIKVAGNAYFFTQKNSTENRGMLNYPIRVINKGLDIIEDFLVSSAELVMKEVFGAEGEVTKEFSGNIDLNFNVKVHSASKKLDLINFTTSGSLKDQSQLCIAPSAGLLIQLKISANVKVPVRAMNLINYASTDSQYQNIEAGGKLDVKGSLFYQRNYIFNTSKKQHFSQDSVIFTGLGGEYGYDVKVKKKKKKRKNESQDDLNMMQEPKKFMLMEPYIITYNEIPLFNHPAQK